MKECRNSQHFLSCLKLFFAKLKTKEISPRLIGKRRGLQAHSGVIARNRTGCDLAQQCHKLSIVHGASSYILGPPILRQSLRARSPIRPRSRFRAHSRPHSRPHSRAHSRPHSPPNPRDVRNRSPAMRAISANRTVHPLKPFELRASGGRMPPAWPAFPPWARPPKVRPGHNHRNRFPRAVDRKSVV